MGTVFKKTYTSPVPKGAEITSRKGERIAKWKSRGGKRKTGRITTGRDGSERVSVESVTYTAKYRDGQGRIVEKATGCRDESAARQVLAEWERRAEQVRAGVFTPEQDSIADHSRTALEEHFRAYLDFLRTKGTTAKHQRETLRNLQRVSGDCGFGNLHDFERAVFEKWLSLRLQDGMSARTRNGYREAIVAFANWSVESNRLMTNPFSGIPKANQAADPRRQRRALTEDELIRLLDATARRPLLDAMTVRRGKNKGEAVANLSEANRLRLFRLGRERQLIYKTLILTGLRKSELASITVAQVEIDGPSPCLKLSAADAKNRQNSQIPLRADMVNEVRGWLAERLDAARDEATSLGQPVPVRLPANAKLFNVPKALVKIFDRDLRLAGIAKRDERGRTVDVHALRTTFGTHLSKGGVPLRTAQAALRHSDPKLTANVYTDPQLLDVTGALDSLPALPLTGDQGEKAIQTVNLRQSFLAPTLAPTTVQTSDSESFADKRDAERSDSRAGEGPSAKPTPDTTCQRESPEGNEKKMAYPEGFEPPTSWSVARHSIQLSYGYA